MRDYAAWMAKASGFGLFLKGNRRYGLRMLHYWHCINEYIESLPERFFKAEPKAEDYYWSKYYPIFRHTFRLTDGSWSKSWGQIWRRRDASGKWEYRQDPETVEEHIDRVI